MAWFSFNELDKAVVHVIRLASFLSLCFQCVCSLMPSLSPYHLPWVYLDLGYLFMAAPAKCSCCLFPWMWGISSQPPLLILDRVISSQPLLHRAAAAPIYTMSSLFIHLLMDTKLLPYLVCCKQCCFEHWGACIFFNSAFVFFRCILSNEIAGSCDNSISNLMNLCTNFHSGCTNF